MKTQTGIYFFLGLFICNLAQAQDITAFTNVTVLPMDRDQVLATHTVVVERKFPPSDTKIQEFRQTI
ncbi:MAG: hypothetical protein F4069_06150, partial [Rhodothermaceae bacterium]|nr:hypothetical protein [Rhodothermaceae bacterium]MYG69694.1 hypothetical protein [Rhodothermaceae bacterium]MYJ44892.1 hypothetical protein [Rhodothermaceae bacterium]